MSVKYSTVQDSKYSDDWTYITSEHFIELVNNSYSNINVLTINTYNHKNCKLRENIYWPGNLNLRMLLGLN